MVWEGVTGTPFYIGGKIFLMLLLEGKGKVFKFAFVVLLKIQSVCLSFQLALFTLKTST